MTVDTFDTKHAYESTPVALPHARHLYDVLAPGTREEDAKVPKSTCKGNEDANMNASKPRIVQRLRVMTP